MKEINIKQFMDEVAKMAEENENGLVFLPTGTGFNVVKIPKNRLESYLRQEAIARQLKQCKQ